MWMSFWNRLFCYDLLTVHSLAAHGRSFADPFGREMRPVNWVEVAASEVS